MEQEGQGQSESDPQPRKSRRAKRKALASAAMVRGGRKTKPAPTVTVFSCSFCNYSAKNRFDSLRRHYKGKHKLDGAALQQECAKYKVCLSISELNHYKNEVLLQDKSRKYACEKCNKITSNIWEHMKGSRCPVVAAERKLAAATHAEKVWSARKERETQDQEAPDEDEGSVPSASQVAKDIETTGELLRDFWRFCVRSTGTAESTATAYARYVK